MSPGRVVKYSSTVVLTAFVSVTKRGIGQDGSHVIRCQSPIERDLCSILEVLPWVVRYEHQPFTATAAFTDGRHHDYTPDFQVLGAAVRLIIECKPAKKVGTDAVRQQVAIGRAWAAENGYQFLLVTEEQLRAGAFLENARLLRRYARQTVPAPLLRALGAILGNRPGGVPLGSLAEQLATHAVAPLPLVRASLHALLFRRVLIADLAAPLTDDSCIWLPETGREEGHDGASLVR